MRRRDEAPWVGNGAGGACPHKYQCGRRGGATTNSSHALLSRAAAPPTPREREREREEKMEWKVWMKDEMCGKETVELSWVESSTLGGKIPIWYYFGFIHSDPPIHSLHVTLFEWELKYVVINIFVHIKIFFYKIFENFKNFFRISIIKVTFYFEKRTFKKESYYYSHINNKN